MQTPQNLQFLTKESEVVFWLKLIILELSYYIYYLLYMD